MNSSDKEDAAGEMPQLRVDLKMSERQGVEIDYCPQCRGVWLDRGEFDKIIDRAALDAAVMPPAQGYRPGGLRRLSL